MSNTIRWLPSAEIDIAEYRIERSTSSTTGFTSLVVVEHDITDPLLFEDPYFFYVDAAGTNAHYYRIITIDDAANESNPSAVFQPAAAPPTPFNETIGVNHDYGGTNNLKVVDGNGDPIEDVQIRIFTKANYDIENTAIAEAITTSDADGKWADTIFLASADTYTIHFEKIGVFNPTTVEIIL